MRTTAPLAAQPAPYITIAVSANNHGLTLSGDGTPSGRRRQQEWNDDGGYMKRAGDGSHAHWALPCR